MVDQSGSNNGGDVFISYNGWRLPPRLAPSPLAHLAAPPRSRPPTPTPRRHTTTPSHHHHHTGAYARRGATGCRLFGARRAPHRLYLCSLRDHNSTCLKRRYRTHTHATRTRHSHTTHLLPTTYLPLRAHTARTSHARAARAAWFGLSPAPRTYLVLVLKRRLAASARPFRARRVFTLCAACRMTGVNLQGGRFVCGCSDAPLPAARIRRPAAALPAMALINAVRLCMPYSWCDPLSRDGGRRGPDVA